MDRRGFLGLFGTGAVIAPVLAGVALPEVHARIIEPPKVELVSELPGAGGKLRLVDTANSYEEFEVTVRRPSDGAFWTGKARFMSHKICFPVSGLMYQTASFETPYVPRLR